MWAEEIENQRQRAEEERRARIEEDRKIAAEILERKKREEEEMKRQKKEIEERKVHEMEVAKKQSLEEKKKSLLSRLDPKVVCSNTEKPKKKPASNPFAQKFEQLANNAQKQEKAFEELQQKKLKKVKKAQDILKRSKQQLFKLSKENIKMSQDIFKKISKQSLRRSCSREQNKKKSTNSLQSAESSLNTSSKKHMQNYLISQVLFDGKEEVQSSKIRINKVNFSDEKFCQEQDKLKREKEIKKKIKEELATIKKAENEQQIKNEEAKFEAYKKEMEKYLDFVCESEKKTSSKNKQQDKIKIVPKKLKVNINVIKSQFEEGKLEDINSSPQVQSAPVRVNKIDTSKLFPADPLHSESSSQQPKTYVPVIIDKDAFQRTVGMFEKEKREEEEKRQCEERRKARRKEMEAEKQRLIAEKNRLQEEERQKLSVITKQNPSPDKPDDDIPNFDQEKDSQNVLNTSDNENTELAVFCENKVEEKIDIHERIKRELEKLRIEEELQQEKIRKERKKKELMRQIQDEIDKIKEANVPKDKEETPKWLQMVMNPNLRKQKKASHESMNIHASRETIIDEQEKEIIDIEPPKWIQIFQEKSKKIADLKNELMHKKQLARQETCQENNIGSLNQKDTTTESKEHLENNHLKKMDCLQDIAIGKSCPETSILPDCKTVSSENRVKQVKDLLFTRELKDEEDKLKHTEVKKEKASTMKKLFESKLTNDKPKKSVKQPKRKIVQLPEKHTEVKQKKKETVHWKWKEKESKELYDYINSNKTYVPEVLLTKAKQSFEQQISQSEEEILQEEALYDEYLSQIEHYIEQETKNETETIFKETLTAYLDLIDDRPRSKASDVTPVASKTMLSLTNTAVLRNQFELGVCDTKQVKQQGDQMTKGMCKLFLSS